jgi:hypothetical protein
MFCLLFLPLLLVQPHSWNAIVVSKFNAFGRKRCLNGHQLREACRYLTALDLLHRVNPHDCLPGEFTCSPSEETSRRPDLRARNHLRFLFPPMTLGNMREETETSAIKHDQIRAEQIFIPADEDCDDRRAD